MKTDTVPATALEGQTKCITITGPNGEIIPLVRMTLEVTRSAPAEIQDAAIYCFAELECRITEILRE